MAACICHISTHNLMFVHTKITFKGKTTREQTFSEDVVTVFFYGTNIMPFAFAFPKTLEKPAEFFSAHRNKRHTRHGYFLAKALGISLANC